MYSPYNMYNNYVPNFPNYQPSQQNNIPQSNMNWIRVPNVEQARNVSVQPNNSAWIMIENDNSISVKNSDSSGITNQRFFKLTEYTPGNDVTEDIQYVTKDEFEKFKKEIMKNNTKKKAENE